jgi:hypothetical protein
VTLLSGSLHRHLGRDTVGEGEVTGVDQCGQGVDDRGGELSRIHRTSLSAGLGFLPGSAGR